MVWRAGGTSSGSPQDLQRIENLTETTTAPTQELKVVDLPDVGAEARVNLFNVITKFEMAAYTVATIALLAFAVATAAGQWRVPARLEQAFAGLVLCGSVVAFSLSMAVVDVLGFPILRWGASYDRLGYTPPVGALRVRPRDSFFMAQIALLQIGSYSFTAMMTSCKD